MLVLQQQPVLQEFYSSLYIYFTADTQDALGCAHNQLTGFEKSW